MRIGLSLSMRITHWRGAYHVEMPGKKRRREQKELQPKEKPEDILSSPLPPPSPIKDEGFEPKSKKRLHFRDEVGINRNYWIMKSEPNVRMVKGMDVSYSLSQLMGEPGQMTIWDGVRNHEAKMNILSMKVGDIAFFYHSSCKDPGFVGLVTIIRSSYPDPSQFEPTHPFFDPKSSTDDPRWFSVDVKFVRRLQRPITLSELRSYQREHSATNGPLKDLSVIRRQRLSVLPMSKTEYDFVIQTLESRKYID